MYLVEDQLDGDIFKHISGHVLIRTRIKNYAWSKECLTITYTYMQE